MQPIRDSGKVVSPKKHYRLSSRRFSKWLDGITRVFPNRWRPEFQYNTNQVTGVPQCLKFA